jgi:hypothetical protein
VPLKKPSLFEDNIRRDKKNWLQVPDGGLIPEQIDQLTVDLKIT